MIRSRGEFQLRMGLTPKLGLIRHWTIAVKAVRPYQSFHENGGATIDHSATV